VKAALNPISPPRLRQECVLNRPAISEPPGQQSFIQAVNFCPLGHTPPLTLKFNKDIGLDVSLLRFDVCPAAVFWSVAFSAVNAIYRAAVWALPHIGQKVLKTKPLIAHSHSKSSVSTVFIVPWIGTPTHHVDPSGVGRRLFPTHHMPVRLGLFHGFASALSGAMYASTCINDALSRCKNTATVFAGCLDFHAVIIQQDKQSGKTLRGLTIRRQAEYKQCKGE
jgi:hypothetical protein